MAKVNLSDLESLQKLLQFFIQRPQTPRAHTHFHKSFGRSKPNALFHQVGQKTTLGFSVRIADQMTDGRFFDADGAGAGHGGEEVRR